ncbi:MAG: hypothetical protein RDV41_00155 [Planctomycetota bacterium]|nr:hypothetical protein [Planctomycetota bacterium]
MKQFARFLSLAVLALSCLALLFGPGVCQEPQPAGPYEGKSFDECLDEALKAIKLTRADLEFEKQYSDDPFRVHAVRELLQRPAGARDRAESLCAAVERFHPDTSRLIGLGVNETDVATAIGEEPKGAPTFPEILKSVYAKAGESLDAKRLKKAEDGFKSIPAPVQNALTDLLSLMSASLGETIESSAPLSAEEHDRLVKELPLVLEMGGLSYETAAADSLVKIIAKVSRSRLYMAATALGSAVDAACRTLKTLPQDKAWGAIAFQCDTPYGPIIVRGTGDDVHPPMERTLLLVDLGGNDTYNCQAGAARGKKSPLSVLIDLGGDDLYRASGPFAQGAGLLGIGFLVDAAGNDTYLGGSFCQGCGILGVGMLRDTAGSDRYFGDTCVQGAGAFGLGLMLDGAGNDVYNAALHSQAFGGPGGFGLLHDLAGNDLYSAGGKYLDGVRFQDRFLALSQGCGLGIKPVASGGIGLLLDSDGNDVYSADVFGQGLGYWFGLGLLVDSRGQDTYSACQYAQGMGIHGGVGLLIEGDGNDKYNSKGFAQGCGHDLAIGMVFDLKGNDAYCSSEMSQGVGSSNGIGLLADHEGHDCYASSDDRSAQGYGNARRDFGSIGILLDMSGSDSYSSARAGYGRNDSLWTKAMWGVGMDVETKKVETGGAENK